MRLTLWNGTQDAELRKSFAAVTEELMNAFDAVEFALRGMKDGATKEEMRSCAIRVLELMRGRAIEV